MRAKVFQRESGMSVEDQRKRTFDWKLLVIFVIPVLGFVSTWAVIQYRLDAQEKQDERAEADQTNTDSQQWNALRTANQDLNTTQNEVTGVKKDVEYIKESVDDLQDDVKDINVSQQAIMQQQTMILQAIENKRGR